MNIVEHASTSAPFQVADLLIAYLEQIGVEYVFGIPGGAIEPLYNALARSQRRGGIRPVLARNEAGAAFMADGYARETGKLGVCCATTGPGATNLITGVSNAYCEDIPILVLTGQSALPMLGRGAFQESSCTGVNTLGMFAHCTRYNSLVSHADQMESKLIAALMQAYCQPYGPVHLTIPVDIQKTNSPVPAPSYDLTSLLQPSAIIDCVAVESMFHLIETSCNIVLLIGASCGEAVEEIMRFAHLKKAKLLTTPDAKGLVDVRHPQYCGVFGVFGHASAEAALADESVDLILAVGANMVEWNSSNWSDLLLNERLIHIAESEEHLQRSPMAKLHVRGRIVTVFEHLLTRLQLAVFMDDEARVGAPDLKSDAYHAGLLMHAQEKFFSEAVPIMPQRLMQLLGSRFPQGTRFIADAGSSAAWAIHYLQPEPHVRPGSRSWLRVTMDFAPMGWAIGAAVGTAMGNPDVPIVCITGDGSMLMNGQEISVAVAEKLTVVYVVLNDSALAMVKYGQRQAGAEPIAFELPPTDFAAIARGLGAQAFSIRAPEDFLALDMDAICSRSGPTLLDVYINPDEVPPKNREMRVRTFSESAEDL